MREDILDVRNREFRARPDEAIGDAGREAQHATPLRVVFHDLLHPRDAAGLLVEGDGQCHSPLHARGIVVAVVLADAAQFVAHRQAGGLQYLGRGAPSTSDGHSSASIVEAHYLSLCQATSARPAGNVSCLNCPNFCLWHQA